MFQESRTEKYKEKKYRLVITTSSEEERRKFCATFPLTLLRFSLSLLESCFFFLLLLLAPSSSSSSCSSSPSCSCFFFFFRIWVYKREKSVAANCHTAVRISALCANTSTAKTFNLNKKVLFSLSQFSFLFVLSAFSLSLSMTSSLSVFSFVAVIPLFSLLSIHFLVMVRTVNLSPLPTHFVSSSSYSTSISYLIQKSDRRLYERKHMRKGNSNRVRSRHQRFAQLKHRTDFAHLLRTRTTLEGRNDDVIMSHTQGEEISFFCVLEDLWRCLGSISLTGRVETLQWASTQWRTDPQTHCNRIRTMQILSKSCVFLFFNVSSWWRHHYEKERVCSLPDGFNKEIVTTIGNNESL